MWKAPEDYEWMQEINGFKSIYSKQCIFLNQASVSVSICWHCVILFDADIECIWILDSNLNVIADFWHLVGNVFSCVSANHVPILNKVTLFYNWW